MHARLEKYLLGKQFAGLEAEVQEEGLVFHYVLLEKSGDKVSVKSVETYLREGELTRISLSGIPVTLLITGKGVLYRMVQGDDSTSTESLLRKALPNTNPTDFLCSRQASASGSLLAVMRKEAAAQIEERIRRHCSPVSVSVGALTLQVVRPFISADQLHCGSHSVQFNHRAISTITYKEHSVTEDKISIGDEALPAAALPAFSAALLFSLQNYEPSQELRRSALLEQILFRKLLRASIVFLLVLLSANYFAFLHYRNQAGNLEEQTGADVSLVEEVQSLREEVESRRTFFREAGFLNASSFAWYADQLGHSLPEGITLSEMNFCPRVKTAAEDTVAFVSGLVEISGLCEKSIVLNGWLQNLQEKEWLTAAAIRSYTQEKTDLRGKFTLELQLK